MARPTKCFRQLMRCWRGCSGDVDCQRSCMKDYVDCIFGPMPVAAAPEIVLTRMIADLSSVLSDHMEGTQRKGQPKPVKKAAQKR